MERLRRKGTGGSPSPLNSPLPGRSRRSRHYRMPSPPPLPPPPRHSGGKGSAPDPPRPDCVPFPSEFVVRYQGEKGGNGGGKQGAAPRRPFAVAGRRRPPPPHLVVLLLKQPPSHPHALAQRSSLPPLAHRGGKRPPGRCGMRRPARPSAPPNRCRPRPRRRRKERMPLFECTVTPFDAPYIMGVHPEV